MDAETDASRLAEIIAGLRHALDVAEILLDEEPEAAREALVSALQSAGDLLVH